MTTSRYFAWTLATILCATSVGALSAQTVAAGQTGQSPDPTLSERHPRYVLQREDTLLLTFPLSPELNQTVTVQPDGYINLQNTGSVYAQGLTAPELIEAVKKAYAGVLHDPIINIDITDFQKPFFTVSGQVGKPGQYELRSDTTIAEGLAVAGGMAATGKQQVFLLRRTPANVYEVKKIDVGAILNGKNVTEVPVLKPGDIIYVPEKFITNFRKYVPYTFNGGTYLNPNPL